MNITDKINFIESHDYKVQIGIEHVRIYDPLDKEGWKLVGEMYELDDLLDETIEMIKT